jgi:hypothetical protein
MAFGAGSSRSRLVDVRVRVVRYSPADPGRTGRPGRPTASNDGERCRWSSGSSGVHPEGSRTDASTAGRPTKAPCYPARDAAGGAAVVVHVEVGGELACRLHHHVGAIGEVLRHVARRPSKARLLAGQRPESSARTRSTQTRYTDPGCPNSFRAIRSSRPTRPALTHTDSRASGAHASRPGRGPRRVGAVRGALREAGAAVRRAQ